MHIAAVRALGSDTMTKAWDQCQSVGIIDNRGIDEMMACVAYGSELCAEVVSHLYHFLGASAISRAVFSSAVFVMSTDRFNI